MSNADTKSAPTATRDQRIRDGLRALGCQTFDLVYQTNPAGKQFGFRLEIDRHLYRGDSPRTILRAVARQLSR